MTDDSREMVRRAELDGLRADLRQAEVDCAYWKGRAEALAENRGGIDQQQLAALVQRLKQAQDARQPSLHPVGEGGT